MMGAIDAVCDSARPHHRQACSAGDGGEALVPGDAPGAGDRPPTAAMKKYAASIAKRKGIKPPRGYTKSAAVCRTFLDRYAPRAEPGAESRVSCERAGFRRLGGREAREHRNCPVRQKGNAAGGSRGSENRDATRQMGRREPRSRLPDRRRRFVFHTETRNWRSAWAPDMGRTAGMRRPGVGLAAFRGRGWL